MWACPKENGPEFGMIKKWPFLSKWAIKKRADALFPENFLTPIFICPMVTCKEFLKGFNHFFFHSLFGRVTSLWKLVIGN